MFSACRCSSREEPANIVGILVGCVLRKKSTSTEAMGSLIALRTRFLQKKSFCARCCTISCVRYGVPQLNREPQDKIRAPTIIVSRVVSYIHNLFTLHMCFWQSPRNTIDNRHHGIPPRLSRICQNPVSTLNGEIGIGAVLLSRWQPLAESISSQLFAPMPCLFRR